MNRPARSVPMIVAAVAISVMISSLAAAQDEQSAPGPEKVEVRGVGISGGILVGGELVVGTIALIGVDKLWPYVTLPFVGAAGGGIGGYYLEEASAEGAVALLIGGMALLVPAVILAASAMAYDPESEGLITGGDPEGEAQFSFEMPPQGETVDDGTSTQVESRPEGAPANALPPPGADEPEPVAPESEEGQEEAPPQDDTSIESGATNGQSAKRARIRRAMAGSLLYVDSDGTTAVTVPFVDIRPSGLSKEGAPYRVRPAIEVYFPLLRIDLP